MQLVLQSVHPWRVRRRTDIRKSHIPQISIHAPMEGATAISKQNSLKLRNFEQKIAIFFIT